MTTFIGSDHAGHDLRRQLLAYNFGRYDLVDLGSNEPGPVDYPTIAHSLVAHMQINRGSRGILICGTGEGMCMAANKHSGIRAGIAWKPSIAQAIREHNDANVLCLPARHLTTEQAVNIVKAYLATPFSREPRHNRRVSMIDISIDR